MTIYLACPVHGRVFVHRGADYKTRIDAECLESLVDGVRDPLGTDPCNCPLCHREWRAEYEETVV